MSVVQTARFYPGQDVNSIRRAVEELQNFNIEQDTRRETTAYIVDTLDDVVLVTTGGSNVTVTLPYIDDAQRKPYYIKKIDSGVGVLTVEGRGSETLDGGTITLPGQHDVVVVMSERVLGISTERRNWWTVSTRPAGALPAFLAFDTSGQATVGTTPLTVAFATEAYDTTSNYATPTWTAPLAGKYELTASITHTAAATAADRFTLSLTTSNRTYSRSYIVPPNLTWAATSDVGSVSIAAVADMDAADTASVTLTRAGGTGVFTFATTAGHNYFCGKLV